MVKLTLYTKKDCHLCDSMKEEILNLKKDFQFDYEEAYIENDIELFEKYKERIPVLLFDGKLFAKYKVDYGKLKKKLTAQLEKV